MYEPLRADLRDRLPAAAGAVHADGADVTARSLLETAVAPEDAQAVFDDKVAHRPVLLRPSRSQQPDGRMARRARRQARLAEQGRKRKARPLSAREKRALAKSEAGGKRLAFAQMQGLHELWLEYARDVVGSPLSGHRTAIEERLLGLDLHGAAIRVTACTCPSRVGVAGICVKETKQTLVLVTQANETKSMQHGREPVANRDSFAKEGPCLLCAR